jgi:hypothetical protein
MKYIGLGGGHVQDWYGLHVNQLFYPAMLRGIGTFVTASSTLAKILKGLQADGHST